MGILVGFISRITINIAYIRGLISPTYNYSTRKEPF